MNQLAKNILLADDDLEDQELFKDTISEIEPLTQVQSALNGKQAVDYLSKCGDDELPSLIILDYNMPELNGPQVLKILSSSPRYKGIPKLVWSTSNTNNYIKECREKGATEYFVKPSSMVELRKVVKNMLALRDLPV